MYIFVLGIIVDAAAKRGDTLMINLKYMNLNLIGGAMKKQFKIISLDKSS